MVARGRNSASDNHCAINRSIDVQRHGVNQFLASRTIDGTFKQAGWRFSSRQFFIIALSVRPMMRLAHEDADPRDHVLHANTTLVDRVDLATPLSLSSQPATGLSALAPAQRAGAQRLCALLQVRLSACDQTKPRGVRMPPDSHSDTPDHQ